MVQLGNQIYIMLSIYAEVILVQNFQFLFFIFKETIISSGLLS